MNSGGQHIKAGVIAAGSGTRLRAASNVSKPLTRVAGRPLIEWVLTSLGEAGASEVVIIINDESAAVREHVKARQWPFDLRWIMESTPSSMHSFLRVVETLASDGTQGPFLVSTVDTIAPPKAFKEFLGEAVTLDNDVTMTLALTPIKHDDDNPLFVRWDAAERRILAFERESEGIQYATAGLYFVWASVIKEGELARRDGVHRLRNFLGRLLDRGHRLGAIPLSASIDVDRAIDVFAAEELLKRVPA